MGTNESAPILDFDPQRSAIIEPTMWNPPIDGFPAAAAITWMADAFDLLLDAYPSRVLHRMTIETASIPIMAVDLPEGTIAVALSHVGAPVATLLYEVLVGVGAKTTVAIGSSGGLVPEHPPGTVVVPDAIVRAEGTSYHYAPASLHAHADAGLQDELRAAFTTAGFSTVTGDVWTTDALFRETSDTVAQRVDQGAIAVDMEASALATVAAFRGVRHGHAVYMADTLHGDQWDPTEIIERDADFRYRLLLTAARTAAAHTAD